MGAMAEAALGTGRDAAYADALQVAIGHEKDKTRVYMEFAERSRLGAKMMFTELASEAMMYINSLMLEFEHVLMLDTIKEGADSDTYVDIGVLKTQKLVIPSEFKTPEQAVLVAIQKTEESQGFYERHAAEAKDPRVRTFFEGCAKRMQRRAVDLKEEYERFVLTQM
jgi:rubrerythrin